jgi:Fe2+ transport system protein FeoA
MHSANNPSPTAREENATTLAMLEPKACARITEVVAEPGDSIRLKALGLCIGRSVTLVRDGDPLIVGVLGARIGLSARIAEKIRVEAI